MEKPITEKKCKFEKISSTWFKCSACGAVYESSDGEIDFNFCPNCGEKVEDNN